MRRAEIIRRAGKVCVITFTTCALVACSDKAEKKVGQSVARIDGYELTVHQLNGELQSAQNASMKDEATLKQNALKSLIDRRLLLAEAERNKLDRDPEVMLAVERQKEQVIIQALLQRKAAGVAKPTNEEVQSYYRSNPVLFAKRQVYDMRQLTLAAASYTPEFKSLIDSGKSLDELAAWLEQNNVQFAKGGAARSTADLPPQILASLATLGSGKPFVIKDATRVMVASLQLVKETPVSESEAAPQIEQFLMARKAHELGESELARLRTAAKVEYLDPSLAPTDKADPAVQKASAPGSSTSDEHISKGVSGLK
jgi:peptidyl-prolyl cis-trans isomerase C